MAAESELNERMIRSLIERLGEGRWAAAMRAVQRHQFLPATIWRIDRSRRGNDYLPIHRADDPDRWLNIAYADRAVDTQVDDGCPDAEGNGREVTSSASQPAVVAQMLHELDPQPGERVLEIGAGTGWNAALLAEIVGPDNVTTVEVDPTVAQAARQRLAAAGFADVTVITGDGLLGWPPAAPYQRVIATVGVQAVPGQWVEQVRAGGRLIVPLTNPYQPPGITVLARHGVGAVGRLAGPAAFMAAREQRIDRIRPERYSATAEDRLVTVLHPWWLVGNRDVATFIGQRVHTIKWGWRDDGEGSGLLCLFDHAGDSWASVALASTPPYAVEQAGPRRLFNEVADSHQQWVEAGKPAIDDWVVRVDREGQRLELPGPV